jgi:cell division protein ZapD
MLWNNRPQGKPSALILYEYPLNESIRTMLRLEHLFDRLGQLLPRDAAVDHHFALATMFEVMDVASRADLKSDLLRDLERQRALLAGYRGHPSVSEAALDAITQRIDRAFNRLNELPGKAGQVLTSNDWLMSIRSRISIPGGTCEFDLPAYHAWQRENAERRRADLTQWVGTLMPMAEALKVILGMLRDSGTPQVVAAPAGQFHQSLPPGRMFQLLRLKLDPALRLVPEISGHRLMLAIRLMRPDGEGRLRPAAEDASLELSLCS